MAAKNESSPPPYVDDLPEPERVRLWRVEQALLLTGCTPLAAARFAEGPGDVHRLEALIRDGCPPRVALRIES